MNEKSELSRGIPLQFAKKRRKAIKGAFMKYANLHLHSHYSDGVLSPRELCEEAKRLGYGALAVTDHETVSGCGELFAAAEELGLECLFGAEFTGRDFGKNFHIVGLEFDPTEGSMAEYLRKLELRAYLMTKARFDEMERKELVEGLTWQEICDDAPTHAWFSNEQIFASLVKRKGYTQERYWEYVGNFRAQKVSVTLPEIPKDAGIVISLIRNAGGIAVLAHPHCQTQFLPELYKMGLRGVECDHPDISPEDAEAARAFAAEKGLYISGGTDHTGLLGDYPFLRGDTPGAAEQAKKAGAYHCPLDTDVRCGITKDEFDALKDRVYG